MSVEKSRLPLAFKSVLRSECSSRASLFCPEYSVRESGNLLRCLLFLDDTKIRDLNHSIVPLISLSHTEHFLVEEMRKDPMVNNHRTLRLKTAGYKVTTAGSRLMLLLKLMLISQIED
ncbi:hypothetical protein Tco_1234781 [Tanacetum coccineum]